MQHSLRDPNRDVEHGRIWRIHYTSRPLVEQAEDRRRERPRAARPAQGLRGPDPLPGPPRASRAARQARSSRPLDEVGRRPRARTTPTTGTTCSKPSGSTRASTSSTSRCSKTMLTCPEPKARAAATRVLCYWRDRVEGPARTAPQAGQRREPPRPPRSRPRPQLLRRQGRLRRLRRSPWSRSPSPRIITWSTR